VRLKRLELQGFKSFLDRTILTFEKGITGVVGPNGCGKSNIVDAIMWVMGEQSAKHLRGDTMTDVIFNGSDSRSATGMAEVSLILDRENSVLSPAFASFQISDEISVTRRVYRDGVGEYLINKQPCRLKDIHELFMDTGLGKRAYSIIEQGQIDRMINVKPDERKYLFEEVAGVTKYKTKRKEAEKKLELAKQNILRVQDIIVELEKQIRSLKIQATKAKKYREMKDELEIADLFLMGRELYECEKKLEVFVEKKRECEDLKVELETLLSSLDAQISELEITRIDQEKTSELLNQEERNLSLSIEKIDGKLNVLEERKKFLQINLENSEAEKVE
jgi:chromosome segregation protein